MTSANTHKAISPRLDEAISWHVRMDADDAGEADWLEFAQWLEADPENRLAYDRVEDLDLELDDPALAANEATNVVSFRRIVSRPVWIAAGGLLAASLIVAVMVRNAPQAPIDYATSTGQTKSVMLADGTRIELNTATKIEVMITGDARRIALDKGEAYFQVAEDRRPFTVRVGNRMVRDIGTKFDILRDSGAIAVTVAEGRVSVTPQKAPARAVALAAGERLVYSRAGGTHIEHVDPSETLAWRQGYLVYRDAPLSKVVSDLNRYFPVPITLDKAAASQRFSGVLKVDDEKAVLKRISLLLPITVEYGADGKIALHLAAPKP